MVQGIIDAQIQNTEPGNASIPPDTLYALPGYFLTLPAILDELSRMLGAEGVGLIKYDTSQGEVLVELGRVQWSRWTGARFPSGKVVIPMMMTTGQVPLNHGSTPIIPSTLSSQSPDCNYLAHTPLLYKGYNFGALWVGHNRRISPDELSLFDSMGNVVADLIYCLARDHQQATSTLETIQALIKLLAAWHIPTYQHSLRLVPWATDTARRMGLKEVDIQTLGWAALLHDIGKLGIPKRILEKPGPLDEDEWKIMKRHPIMGAKMLEHDPQLTEVMEIVLTHHEKVDGTGYPAGLKGASIPVSARILAVVDAYGAMTEPRAYVKTFTHKEALEEIKRCSATHFDPVASKAFLAGLNFS